MSGYEVIGIDSEEHPEVTDQHPSPDTDAPDENDGIDDGGVIEPPAGTVDEVLVLEAALYTSGRALTARELNAATGIPSRRIPALFRRLSHRYEDRETALMVTRIGSKYTMQLKPAFIAPVRKLATPEIPKRLLKTAALIGYHQPVKQTDLKEMIGDRVYEHVRVLTELGLLVVKKKGAHKILSTSIKFSEYFGIPSTDPMEIRRILAKRMGVREYDRESISDWAEIDATDVEPGENNTGISEPVDGPVPEERKCDTDNEMKE